MQPRSIRWILPFVVLPITTCSDSSRPAPTSPQALAGPPLCQVGCNETDPNPRAPGVFLGSGVTAIQCFDAMQTDGDQDGLGDFCEKSLAAAFAPELAYCQCDNFMGREPHWVARPLNWSVVRVGYLLSYYVDGGTDEDVHPECRLSQGACDGHYGDSEGIFLDIAYNAATQHWVLKTARYSAHGSYHVYDAGSGAYPSMLTYPSHPGAYPRSYVAINKHANSGNLADCEAGGFLETDDCIADAFSRLAAGQYLNLGSRAYPFLDCTSSSNPLYQDNGVIECYWTGLRFSGWQGALPDTRPYTDQLATFGF